jgi:hypothetical protein
MLLTLTAGCWITFCTLLTEVICLYNYCNLFRYVPRWALIQMSSCVSGRTFSVNFNSANKYGRTDVQGVFDYKLSIKAVKVNVIKRWVRAAGAINAVRTHSCSFVVGRELNRAFCWRCVHLLIAFPLQLSRVFISDNAAI